MYGTFWFTSIIYLSLGLKILNMISAFALLLGMGAQEIIVVLIIILLLFGGKKIPELMKGLGRGVKEFKDASKGEGEAGQIEKK